MSSSPRFRGFSTHRIGSRNLDNALAGDFDADGAVELLVPTQNKQMISIIQHTTEGPAVLWSLPVDGEAITNFAAAETADGIIVGVGRADGVLRLWIP